MVRAALAVANTRPAELHAVAYTAGPGLIGALRFWCRFTAAAFLRLRSCVGFS